ncbi:hypothetical protein VTI74DRAFT_4065 [Chaetomium olivicolor]
MGHIYQGTDNVCVWLGPESDDSEGAMDIMQSLLADLPDFFHLDRMGNPEEVWGPIVKLLERDWFTRRWLVQEIALAKRAMVQCGHREVPWADVSDAISLFDTHRTNNSLLRAFDTRGVGALSLSYLAENALTKDGEGNILERSWGMGDLLAMLPMFHVQEPHDVVYSILSLASDSAPLQSVDYAEPYERLVTKVFKAIAASSRSLDMLFRPWAPAKPGHKLPSFIAPASRYSDTRAIKGAYERIYRATPHLATSPVLTLPVADPSRSLPMGKLFEVDRPAERSNNAKDSTPKLVVRGVICAFVEEVGEASDGSIIPRQWLSMWLRQEEQLRDMWRVLVGGRSHEGTAAPNWYRRAFELAFGNAARGEQSSIPGTNSALPSMIQAARSALVANFLRRVSACVWERRYLASTRDRPGYFGLVPRNAARGDMICLLEGCSMPVVIRGRRMLKVAEQALRAALLPTTERLVPLEIEDKIVLSMSFDLSSWLDQLWGVREIESRVYSFISHSSKEIWGINSEALSEDEYVKEQGRHINDMLRAQIAPRLMDMVSKMLQRISERQRDMIESALEFLFGNLLIKLVGDPESLVLPSACATQVLEEDLKWADGLVRQEFQAYLWCAFKQAFEERWRWLVQHGLELFYRNHSGGSSGEAVELPDQNVWREFWEPAWAASEERAVELCSSRGVATEMWPRSFQRALEAWADRRIGTTRAYGGEVIGECYIQGLMDGEWWNSNETKSQSSSIFIIE